jgi:hypothetical protein
MNPKVQQTVIDSQNFNSLRRLRKMQSLVNGLKDEFGQLNWNSDLELRIDLGNFNSCFRFIEDSITNWIEAIKDND